MNPVQNYLVRFKSFLANSKMHFKNSLLEVVTFFQILLVRFGVVHHRAAEAYPLAVMSLFTHCSYIISSSIDNSLDLGHWKIVSVWQKNQVDSQEQCPSKQLKWTRLCFLSLESVSRVPLELQIDIDFFASCTVSNFPVSFPL